MANGPAWPYPPSVAWSTRCPRPCRHLLTHSSASLEHLKEARATFEMEMVRIAARRRRPVTSRACVRWWRRRPPSSTINRASWNGTASSTGRIASISGNPVFVSVSEALFGWLANFHIHLVRSPGEENLTIGEHQEIIATIAEGNAHGAATAMGDHLSRANRLYQRTGASSSTKDDDAQALAEASRHGAARDLAIHMRHHRECSHA